MKQPHAAASGGVRQLTPLIRLEAAGDQGAIDAVHLAAFKALGERDLVRALRTGGALTLSLVAERGTTIIGHVAFSPVTISNRRVVQGLSPVGVLPDEQRRGVGRALIEEGLARLEADAVTGFAGAT